MIRLDDVLFRYLRFRCLGTFSFVLLFADVACLGVILPDLLSICDSGDLAVRLASFILNPIFICRYLQFFCSKVKVLHFSVLFF